MAGQTKCVLCGKSQLTEPMIYSRHTGWHYCPDINACDRRRARQVKRFDRLVYGDTQPVAAGAEPPRGTWES
jgi:hypothetical protein